MPAGSRCTRRSKTKRETFSHTFDRSFALASLLVLGGARLGLVLWQLDRVRAAHIVGMVFLQGLRFDLVLLGFLLLPPVLTLALFATSRAMSRAGAVLLRCYLVTCFALLVFLELATPSFINQYDARPNQIFVEYLIYPKEVASTLVTAYRWQLIGALIVVAVASTLLFRALRSGGRQFCSCCASARCAPRSIIVRSIQAPSRSRPIRWSTSSL
jgi:phosphoglycerol transferase MdoB-like AlkP superfamily enzyme